MPMPSEPLEVKVEEAVLPKVAVLAVRVEVNSAAEVALLVLKLPFAKSVVEAVPPMVRDEPEKTFAKSVVPVALVKVIFAKVAVPVTLSVEESVAAPVSASVPWRMELPVVVAPPDIESPLAWVPLPIVDEPSARSPLVKVRVVVVAFEGKRYANVLVE